jgi:hypothetical protein
MAKNAPARRSDPGRRDPGIKAGGKPARVAGKLAGTGEGPGKHEENRGFLRDRLLH